MLNLQGGRTELAKRRLPKGKMKGKQRGRAVRVAGYSYIRKGKRINVGGYRRGRAGGKLG